MEFLKNLIIGGQIPHFRAIRKIALILSFVPIPLYLFGSMDFVEFGKYGWKFLIAIMLIRPLADVFPGLKILHSLVPLRKEVGILSGLLIFIHAFDFFIRKDQLIFISMFDPQYWAWNDALTWGILGFIVLLLLLLTSNDLSIRILRGRWKNIQRLAYPLFFFSATHIALINREETLEVLVPVVIVLILWLLAHFKVKAPLFTDRNTENQPEKN